MSKTDVITRKDMKEPDKFQQAATQAASWVAIRRRQVAIAVAAVIAAIALAGILTAVSSGREERAGAAAGDLVATMGGEISPVELPGVLGPTFPNEEARQRAVVAAAEKILADHGGTAGARLAALALGDAQLKLRQWDAARAAYERFVSDARKDDSLRFAALEGIALAEEGKGDLAAAARAFERMGREAPAFADRADLERARVLAQAGQNAEARELLTGFSERHKQSQLVSEASERLARLGGD